MCFPPPPYTYCTAYKKGNLEWGAAFEVRPAAVSVHANVMDPAGKQLQPEYVTCDVCVCSVVCNDMHHCVCFVALLYIN